MVTAYDRYTGNVWLSDSQQRALAIAIDRGYVTTKDVAWQTIASLVDLDCLESTGEWNGSIYAGYRFKPGLLAYAALDLAGAND